ncbi:MarR family transcriptional regulator [Pusillimonas sp.]|uniref:MarR family winged helix-turn-helix transcriptional regulator n=1 Tax=Pusillimonas sp. TaxID=3040095 RepID=UPI0029B100A5|nr:MarR family transcriptional regulator [Pusillimonas sp.]MDX3893665.1 MarR family transcriptional regulator [Pusillimonas sp.]
MSKSAPSSPRQRSGATGKRAAKRPEAAGYYRGTAESLDPEVSIGNLVKQLQASLTRMMDQRMAPMGLTATQWRPLALIRYHDVNTPAELSRRADIDTGAMTRALDRLEAKKFITRQRSADDRRSVRIELTEAGNEVAEQILPAVAATLNTHLQGFSKDEVELFISMVLRMLSNGEKAP